MKTLLLSILLFPCICNAQKLPTIEQIEKSIVKEKADTSKFSFFTNSMKKWNHIVTNNTSGKYEILAEVDTAGHLKVYGDTLSVLKAIFKHLNVEIKD